MAMATAIRPPLHLLDQIYGHNRLHRFRLNLNLPRSGKRESQVNPHRSFSPIHVAKAYGSEGSEGETEKVKEEEEDSSSYSVLSAMRSQYNEIVVVDTPTSRVLLLDSSHNIHSMLNKEKKWTGSYWDEFASLPAIIPQGPIAILGLGAGTAAHLLLDLWPSLHIEGWEIDEILIDMARDYFGLSALERCTHAGGSLSVCIGDAFSSSVAVPGGFAGIIVDLFSDGKILPQLHEDATWLELQKKLMPNGRIMVNSGGAHTEIYGNSKPVNYDRSTWLQNSTIKALCRVFPGKLSWKRMAEKNSDNYLALTGPIPDLDEWSAVLPDPLNSNVKSWRPCELVS